MAVESTKLSTILNRMNRWSAVYRNTEEQYLVQDLDEALRNLNRNHQLPWTLKKTTLRVFDDILEYPQASDHSVLAILEGQEDAYEDKPRPYYTSIREFYEDPNNRSQIAEIWDNGASYLGVRNKNLENTSRIIDTGETDENYTLSGDASATDVDTVFYKKGNGSMKITVTDSADTFTVEHTFTAFTDSDYKRKYYFRWIYLASVPTSISLRFGADSSNFLLKSGITTQFSGQAFKAGEWNLVGFDLNDPTSTTGTISTTTSFDYEAIIVSGVSTGSYYLDESSLRQWSLMDYWYYSNFNCMTVSASVADQRYFMDDSGVYSTDIQLVGPKEYADVAMYDAMVTSLTDVENSKVLSTIREKRQAAWDTLLANHPSLEPNIITHYWRFASQMGNVVSGHEAGDL